MYFQSRKTTCAISSTLRPAHYIGFLVHFSACVAKLSHWNRFLFSCCIWKVSHCFKGKHANWSFLFRVIDYLRAQWINHNIALLNRHSRRLCIKFQPLGKNKPWEGVNAIWLILRKDISPRLFIFDF